MVSDYIETLIVGAGISGLMAGKVLSQAGINNLVLEKSRGVGGRMATRYFKGGVFDHGAQFFTVRDGEFQKWVAGWQEGDAVQEWFGHESKEAASHPDERHPRFIGTKGMTSVPKELAKGLRIHTNTQVNSISRADDLWVAHTNRGDDYHATQLILSTPVPQSLSLLEAGGVSIPKYAYEALLGIDYQPCIAMLVLLVGPSEIPSPGGKKFDDSDIQWLGDNSQKGISPDLSAVTIHASVDFSRKNFTMAPEEIAHLLIGAASDWLGQEVLDWQIHKWRYSQPIATYKERFLELPALSGLYLVGDAFGGARVEGAALSGIEAAAHIREVNSIQ